MNRSIDTDDTAIIDRMDAAQMLEGRWGARGKALGLAAGFRRELWCLASSTDGPPS